MPLFCMFFTLYLIYYDLYHVRYYVCRAEIKCTRRQVYRVHSELYTGRMKEFTVLLQAQNDAMNARLCSVAYGSNTVNFHIKATTDTSSFSDACEHLTDSPVDVQSPIDTVSINKLFSDGLDDDLLYMCRPQSPLYVTPERHPPLPPVILAVQYDVLWVVSVMVRLIINCMWPLLADADYFYVGMTDRYPPTIRVDESLKKQGLSDDTAIFIFGLFDKFSVAASLEVDLMRSLITLLGISKCLNNVVCERAITKRKIASIATSGCACGVYILIGNKKML